jgi:hypothetical protein
VLYRKTIIMQEAGNAYRLADWQAPDTAEKPHHLLSPSNEQPVDECYARTLRPWTDTGTGKAIKKCLHVTTTLTNGRIESHHHKHLHLQPAWLVPWITLCHSRDLLCSALQLVPNSAVGCSTSFRPKTFSSASRVLSKAKG